MTEKKNLQRLMKLPFIRDRLYGRALEDFMVAREIEGITLRNDDVPERLCGIRTLIVDASLVMQGHNAVRLAAAPLAVCGLDRLKHESAWMMLTAGVALGCEGYAPLEGFIREMGFSRERMLRQYPCLRTMDYDDARGVETTIHRDAGGYRAFAKGSPEAIAACCARILDGKERLLDNEDREHIRQTALRMERNGLRALAFATRRMAEGDNPEDGMTYLGMVAMGDRPHPHIPAGMEALRRVGIRPVLAAGHDVLPGAVDSCGVLRPQAGILHAEEMTRMDDHSLREAVRHADAFLGVDWSGKARLARALRDEGLVGVLSIEPEGGGTVLAIGGGAAPDVLLQHGGLEDVAALLAGCHTLHNTYNTQASTGQ